MNERRNNLAISSPLLNASKKFLSAKLIISENSPFHIASISPLFYHHKMRVKISNNNPATIIESPVFQRNDIRVQQSPIYQHFTENCYQNKYQTEKIKEISNGEITIKIIIKANHH